MSLFSKQSTVPGTKKKIDPVPAETKTKEDIFDDEFVKHWKRLAREVKDAPSLGTFGVRLDGVQSNLMKLKTSLVIESRLVLMTFNCPSQLTILQQQLGRKQNKITADRFFFWYA